MRSSRSAAACRSAPDGRFSADHSSGGRARFADMWAMTRAAAARAEGRHVMAALMSAKVVSGSSKRSSASEARNSCKSSGVRLSGRPAWSSSATPRNVLASGIGPSPPARMSISGAAAVVPRTGRACWAAYRSIHSGEVRATLASSTAPSAALPSASKEMASRQFRCRSLALASSSPLISRCQWRKVERAFSARKVDSSLLSARRFRVLAHGRRATMPRTA